MTNPQRWRRLSALFDRAIDLDADARVVLLDAQCADDPALRAELEAMLSADTHDAALDAGAAGLVDSAMLTSSAPADADADALDDLGRHLGHWQLERVLGRGGMGTVYAARRDDRDTHQRAAVKRLHRRWDGSLQAQRFLQERRILVALSHPNVPRLIDHGTDHDARPWFALELIEGESIIAWADAHRLDLRERIDLFRQVCAAVQHAHEHFVVHRDLKPANILVDEEGHPKVLDFGVAKRMDDAAGATRTGAFAGFTPEYAAPEQISGGTVSAATDVYALGVILYQLLTGRLPLTFDHDDLHATAQAITLRTAAPLDQAITTGTPHEIDARLQQRGVDLGNFRRFVRGDLSRIVQTALAKEPQRRYASVQAFSSDLQRLLQGRTVSVSGDTFGYRSNKFIQRNRWGVAMGVLAAVALLAGFIGIAMKTRESQFEAVRAESSAKRAKTQELRAQAEATRAAASRDFLASLLGEASPEKNGGEETTVRQVLDRARARIDVDFVEQPELRVEMMTLIASTYADLSRYDDGKSLLVGAVKIADTHPGIAASVRANAHAEYAFSLLSDSKATQAEAEAAKAVALLRQESPTESLMSALGTLATARYLQEEFGSALEAQREATRLIARLKGPGSDEYAEGLLETSYFLDGAGRSDEAVIEASNAVVLLERKHPDGRDPAVSRALWALGSALCSAGRAPEAIPPLQRALVQVEAIYGTQTLKYMRSLQLLGRAEVGAGHLDVAIAHLQQSHRLLQAQAPDHPIATLVQLSLGEAQLRNGDATAAVSTLRKTLASLKNNPVNATSRIDTTTVLLARAYDAAGKHLDAEHVLSARIQNLRQRKPASLMSALVALASNSRARGDRAGAVSFLSEAERYVNEGTLPMPRAELALEQARLADDAHDHKTRFARASQARKLLLEHGLDAAPELAESRMLMR